MNRAYELFEKLEDGSPVWRDSVVGLENARRRLEEIAKATPNECFAMYLPTKEIVVRLNVRTTEQNGARRV